MGRENGNYNCYSSFKFPTGCLFGLNNLNTTLRSPLHTFFVLYTPYTIVLYSHIIISRLVFPQVAHVLKSRANKYVRTNLSRRVQRQFHRPKTQYLPMTSKVTNPINKTYLESFCRIKLSYKKYNLCIASTIPSLVVPLSRAFCRNGRNILSAHQCTYVTTVRKASIEAIDIISISLFPTYKNTFKVFHLMLHQILHLIPQPSPSTPS